MLDFHYQCEAIHPFIDGNGHIGRLLQALLLVHWKLLSLLLLYLSVSFERRRQMYDNLLMAVSAPGAWRDWLGFFLHGVAQQARDAIRRAQRLQDLQTEWRQQSTQTHSSILLLRLMDSFFEPLLLTIPMAQGLLRVTYPSAQWNVEKLGQAGIVRQVGECAHGKVCIGDRILQVL